jgi:hypothetical protein
VVDRALGSDELIDPTTRHPMNQKTMSRAARSFRSAGFLFVVAVLAATPTDARAACTPAGYDRPALDALKATGFAIADSARRNAFALAIADCLGDADPAIRDGLAFEALQKLMREKALAPATIVALRDKLLPQLAGPEGDGFARPFAALVLAEVARTDRVAPWMTAEERVRMVDAAVAYLGGVRDYRGYDEREGWRHGVAHGADLVMQLAYNTNVGKPELERILGAVASQVAPSGHFYTYGEGERLANPVIAVARRNVLTAAEWEAFFKQVMDPAPLAQWRDAYKTQAGLAKKHDTLGFLSIIYLNAKIGGADALAPLLPGVEAGIRALP